MNVRAAILGLGLSLAVTSVALADGDPAKGEKIFVKCKACHYIENDKNKIGPHLSGVWERKAASVDGYSYSSAMKAKGQAGLVWNADTLDQWLTNPRKFVPGTKMAFVGLPKAEDRADVIAYIKKANGK